MLFRSGTTGLAYINNFIKPDKPARVYNTLDAAVAALQSGQIDAIVVDTPTGQYMAGYQIVDKKNKPLAVQVGQFPAVGEHYGLLFQKGNALVGCVDQALDTLKANGVPAAALFSGITEAERRDIEAQAAAGQYRLLFVAPERLVPGINASA